MSNTLGGINLAQIAQNSLDYFKSSFLPLKTITRDFSQDIMQKGESVSTRIITGLSDADLSSGFSASNATTTAVTVSLSNYRGVCIALTDLEVTKAGSLNWLEEMFLVPMVEGVLNGVFNVLLPLVTTANFSGEKIVPAANFDVDAIVDLDSALSTNKISRTNRSLFLKPTYTGPLKKDNSVQAAYAIGGTEVVRQGNLPALSGFTPYEITCTVPDNGQFLEGFACHPAAFAMAARQIATPPNFTGQIENVSESETGLPLQWRTWYDHTAGKTFLSVGSLWGFTAGVGSALIRIKSQ